MNIFKRAKQLQRQHPRMAWQDLVQKASAENKPQKAKPVKHKKAKKVQRVKHVQHYGMVGAAATVSHHKKMIREGLEDKMAKLMIRAFHATTKTDRRKFNKEIAEVKKELRHFC